VLPLLKEGEKAQEDEEEDLKEKKRYCNLEDETLSCPLWGTHFGIGYGPIARQTK
jgi:hypothetical protein